MTKIETLCSGKWLLLKRKGRWEYAERTNPGGGVLIVAVTDAGELLLVEQYRAAIDSATIELPAGLVGDLAGSRDENAIAAAHRELLEETGYRAARINLLTSGPSSAGMSNEILALVRARGLVRENAGGGDDTEQITVHKVALDKVAHWLLDKSSQGFQVDPRVFAALYFIEHDELFDD